MRSASSEDHAGARPEAAVASAVSISPIARRMPWRASLAAPRLAVLAGPWASPSMTARICRRHPSKDAGDQALAAISKISALSIVTGRLGMSVLRRPISACAFAWSARRTGIWGMTAAAEDSTFWGTSGRHRGQPHSTLTRDSLAHRIALKQAGAMALGDEVAIRPSTTDDFDSWFELYDAVAAEGKWIGGESPNDREEFKTGFRAPPRVRRPRDSSGRGRCDELVGILESSFAEASPSSA